MSRKMLPTDKKVVTFGEIMLRLTTPGFRRFSQANELIATYGGSGEPDARKQVGQGVTVMVLSSHLIKKLF